MPWVRVTGRSVLGRKVKHDDAERRGLLLHAAGVGDDRARAGLQRQEVQVADRLDAGHARVLEAGQAAVLGEPRTRARVDREHDRSVAGELHETVDDPVQAHRLVDVGGPVQRDEHVLALLHADGLPDAQLARLLLAAAQRVDHRVADVVDAARADALGLQVLDRLGAVREQHVRQAVGEDAVDLLRHAPVERAQPGLEVGDGDAHLRRGERAGERGVHVAGDEHDVGLGVDQDLLERRQHLGRLHAVGAGADAEEDVDLGELQVGQDLVGHPAVVVLAGVDDDLAERLPALERGDDGRHLDEVRARADDVDDGRPAVGDPAVGRLGDENEVRWLRGGHCSPRAYVRKPRGRRATSPFGQVRLPSR